MTTTSERLKEAMELRNIKQSELVEKTGINKGALSSYLAGRYSPKQGNLFLLAKALNVNEAWLMGADVPMDRKRSSTSPRALSPDQEELLSDYEKLNREGKAAARERVRELTELSKYRQDTASSSERAG